MGVAICRGGYGALPAFSMSAFARWFAVHLVQAFVWPHAHRLPRLRLRSRPRDFWAVPEEMGADFAIGPEFLCGFWRELFAVGSADLGKRRRVVVFRVDSACETAQKLQVGLAGR